MAKQTYKKHLNRKPRGANNNTRTFERKPVEKIDAITYQEGITVGDLAAKLHRNSSEIIKILFMLGKMVTINSQLEDENVELVCMEFGIDASKEEPKEDETLLDTEEDDPNDLVERAPIVTIMGHVDHGKTTLLDYIRNSRVVEGEFGGITQHIGAYQVKVNDKLVTFLDTPGHEAFTAMRARGASVTDIVILVVGADDGIMPQTREAINHIRAADVPLVVAINKIDKPGAKPDRVRQQLSELGIFTEGWGGDVGAVEISAKQGTGVADLLERVLLEAEMQELKADENASPEGVVIEARLDKGKGPVATVIVKNGTLKAGDIVLFNSTWGKIRALFDWSGKGLKKAGPSTPVEILGLDGVPNPGEAFRVVKNEREARDAISQAKIIERESQSEAKKASFEDLYSNLAEGQLPHLKLQRVLGDLHTLFG